MRHVISCNYKMRETALLLILTELKQHWFFLYFIVETIKQYIKQERKQNKKQHQQQQQQKPQCTHLGCEEKVLRGTALAHGLHHQLKDLSLIDWVHALEAAHQPLPITYRSPTRHAQAWNDYPAQFFFCVLSYISGVHHLWSFCILRVPDQNGISQLYNMLQI